MVGSVEIHIGNRIATARRLRQFTQDALGQELGVGPEEVQRYEQGEDLAAGRLYDIARALEVDVSYFYEGLRGATSCPFSLSNERYLLLRRAVQRIAADSELTRTGHRKRLPRHDAINIAREICETLGWSYSAARTQGVVKSVAAPVAAE